MSTQAKNNVREGAEWQQARRRTLRGDQYRCQHCGRREGNADLHVHHIRPVEKGGTNDLENLTTLCLLCHNKLHRHYDDRGRLELDLLNEDRVSLGFPDYRIDRTSDGERQVLNILREEGPTKRKELAERVDYSYQYVGSILNQLQTSNHIVRVSRGIYGYIPTLEYRRSLSREPDEQGRRPVGYWDPGEQAELIEFADDPREDSDE